MDPNAAARAILRVLDDQKEWNGLAVSGKVVLQTLPTQAQKHQAYKAALRQLVAR
jgi:hypothetical protein